MHHVYLLKSKTKEWFYIGSTSDLHKRFSQHNAGQVKSTKGHRPLELVYSEEYVDSTEARKREIQLKRHSQQKEILLAKFKA